MTPHLRRVSREDGNETNTRQREAILTSSQASGRSLSVSEILQEAARDVPNLSPTTVYRQLKGLVEEAAVHPVDLPGQSTRYEAPCIDAEAVRER